MTREEWASFEKVQNEPNVQLAMRARCEEQGHEFEGGMTFGAGHVFIYQICKWCGERRS